MLREAGSSRCGVLFLLFALLASCGGGHRAESPPLPPRAEDAGSPSAARADRLYAQLWMEISPEYRAACLQTFHAAADQIRSAVRDARRVAGAPVGARGKPLAVVADLDETILDTSGYQVQLVLQGVEYTSESWEGWVNRGEGAKAVPGALEFLSSIRSLGLKVVFISNRRESLRAATIRALEELGLDTGGMETGETSRLLLRTTTSSKEHRRRQVLERYDVAAFLGDSIGDFPGISENVNAAQRFIPDSPPWGITWFILPNPVYGSWTDTFRDVGPRRFLQNRHPEVR